MAVAAVLLAACSGDAGRTAESPSTVDTPTPTTQEIQSDLPTSTSVATSEPASTSVFTPVTSLPDPRHCPADGRAWDRETTAEMSTLTDQPNRILATVYPTPDYQARLWSQWGQGIVLPDGRFLSAIGDHEGRNGNSYFYVYDPQTQVITMISDVLSLTDHFDGDWGFGKVHAQMVSGPCGDVYVTSYWGTRSGLEFGSSYMGDILIRIDPQSEAIDNLGTLIPGFGVPSLAISPDGRILFAEGADPFGDSGVFVATDLTTGEEVFRDEDSDHIGFRAMAVDTEGRAYYSLGAGRLRRYDPTSGEVMEIADPMPGDFLRAATSADENGTLVAVTQGEPAFFTLDRQKPSS